MFKNTVAIMAITKSHQDIKIQITRNFRDINISLPKLRKLIKIICLRFGKNGIINPGKSPMKYEISIAIVDDSQFQKINLQFLGRDSISDCLSFDLSDGNEPGLPKTFELVINGQMALRQANLRGHSEEAELALYVTHALLHNFGFDDLEPNLAKNMHQKEDEILQELGFGLVYNRNIDLQKNINRQNRKHKK